MQKTKFGEPKLEVIHTKIEYSLTELDAEFPDHRLREIIETLNSETYLVIRELINAGFEVYLTGGIVCDSLVGRPPKDFDFIVRTDSFDDAISARVAFEQFFGTKSQQDDVISGPYGRIKLTGSRFGVYKLYLKDQPEGTEPLDLALPRTEQAWAGSSGGSSEFDIQANATLPIEDDVSRRDFTINALLLKLSLSQEGQVEISLLDHVGGITDVKSRTLRAVGDPKRRINESLDRALRALRIWKQKGFVPDTELFAAIEKIGPEVLTRKGSDGKPIVSAEKAAPEFLKGFAKDPAGMIEALDRYGILQQYFPELYAYQNPEPGILPKGIDRNLFNPREITFDGEVITDQTIRATSLAHIIEMLRYHKEHFGDTADVTEFLYILLHELCKCTATLKESELPTHRFDQKFATLLTTILAKQAIRRNKLFAFDPQSPLRVNPDTIGILSTRHYQAIGLLNPEGRVSPGKPLSERPNYMQRLLNVFPDLTKDPLFRILESDMQTTPNATVAQTQLTLLRSELTELEGILEKDPEGITRYLSGKALQTAFHLRGGRHIGTILDHARTQAYLPTISQPGFQSGDEVRVALFNQVAGSEVTRQIWSEYADEATMLALGVSNPLEQEQTRRMILREIARICAYDYTGQAHHEIALPQNQERKDDEFFDRFTHQLTKDPDSVLNWLEAGLRSSRSGENLVRVLFPELKTLIGCEQDPLNHAEGDVWTHTKGLFSAAKKQEIALNPELAIAILYHDIGKPAVRKEENGRIRFINHEEVGAETWQKIIDRHDLTIASNLNLNEVTRLISQHGLAYNQWRTRAPRHLEVRSIFPAGVNDNLFQLMRLDTNASIRTDGFDGNTLFNQLKTIFARIELEGTCRETFDRLLVHPAIVQMVGPASISEKHEALYLSYLQVIEAGDILVDSEIDTIIPTLQREFLKQNFDWTLDYVKRIVATGKRLMTEKSLTGKAIGEQQKAIAEDIFYARQADSV